MTRAAALLLIATSCGGGGGSIDAAPPDGRPVDAVPPPDATLPDAPPPPIGTACSVPFDLGGTTEPAAYTTAFAGNATGAACSGGTFGAPELYFVYDAGPTPVDLIVDALVDESTPVAMRYDLVISARTDCFDPQTEVACSGTGWSERLEVLGATGPISLIVDGTNEFMGLAQGSFTIQVRVRAIAGVGEACDPAGAASRCGPDLVCDATTSMCVPTSAELACAAAPDLTGDLVDGSAEVTGSVLASDPDYYQASCRFDESGAYPERLFRFDVAALSDLVASTDDPATTYDTVLSLRAGACDALELACQDDVDVAQGNFRSTLTADALPPGTYYLFLDASSPYVYGPPGTPRDFRLTVSLTPTP